MLLFTRNVLDLTVHEMPRDSGSNGSIGFDDELRRGRSLTR